MGNFGVLAIRLKPGRIHVPGDALSRAPRGQEVDVVVNDVELLFTKFGGVIFEHKDDRFFRPIVKALGDEWPNDSKQRLKLEKLLLLSKLTDKKFLCLNKTWAPGKFLCSLLVIAHDSKPGGHFKFAKTLSRLSILHWQHKARVWKKYGEGCVKCEQIEDSN